MDCHGRMLAHVLLHESDGIVGMSWNCPDFLVEDSTESDTDSDDNGPSQGNSLPYYSGYKIHCIPSVFLLIFITDLPGGFYLSLIPLNLSLKHVM